MKVTQKKLSNDLNTIFINDQSSNFATVQIWFKAGSANELKEEFGMAHFLEHMFFRGSKKYPSHMISEKVESFGGEINAFTSFDYTCYYINTPSKNISTSIDLLLEMVTSPLFNQKDISQEKEVVMEEYKRSYDNPEQFNFMEIQKSFFDNSYKHPILGFPQNIRNFSKKELLRFRKKNYNVDNATFVVAGNFESNDKLVKQIEVFKLPKNLKKNLYSKRAKTTNKKSKTSLTYKDTSEITLNLIIRSNEFLNNSVTNEEVPLSYYFNSDSSQIYKSLVLEKNLVNNISGSTLYLLNHSYHFIKISAAPENFNKVLKELPIQIQKAIKAKISDKELQKTKNQYKASKIYQKESLENYAFNIGYNAVMFNDLYADDQYLEQVEEITSEKFNLGFNRIFQKDINLNALIPNDYIYNDALKDNLNTFYRQLRSLKTVKAETSNKTKKHLAKIKINQSTDLVYQQVSRTNSFLIQIYFKSGLANESATNNGIHNFWSKVIEYGYKGKSFDEYKYDLDTRAITVNAFSGKNACGITAHGMSSDFNFVIDDILKLITQPTFDEQFIKIEKQLSIESLKKFKTNPVKLCFQKFNQIVFNGHPYSFDSIGNEDNIKSFTQEKLETFNKYLKSRNIVVSYVGPDNQELIKEKISNKFCNLNLKGTQNTKVNYTSLSPLKSNTIKIEMDREQSHILIGRKAFPIKRIEHLYIKILNTYLSGQSSPLFVEIRDKLSLCYTVQPIYSSGINGSSWGIYIGTSSEKSLFAKESIIHLLEELRKKGFSKKILSSVKKSIAGQNEISLINLEDYSNYYAIPVLHKLGLNYQEESFNKINNITLEEFNNFLKTFLKRNWQIVEVGN